MELLSCFFGQFASLPARYRFFSRLLYQFHFAAYPHFVAHQYASGIQQHVPGQSPVFAVYQPIDFETGFFISPGVFYHATELNIQFYLPGYAFQGQLSIQLVASVVVQFLVCVAGKGDLLVIFNIQEVGPL